MTTARPFNRAARRVVAPASFSSVCLVAALACTPPPPATGPAIDANAVPSAPTGGAAAKASADVATLQASSATQARVRAHPVAKQELALHLSLVGSVAYNPDRVALVGPLVAGRVATLAAKNGTTVARGQLLAEIESPEAGQAMAQFITAGARSRAAKAQLGREQELAQRHISSLRDLEVADAQAAQAQAELGAAEELLQALGLEAAGVQKRRRGRVPLRSPIDGIVVARYVKLGQAVERSTDAFLVADLSSLWVELEIFERDLERVHVGQTVELRTESLPGQVFAATVAFVEPTVDFKTRTTNLRLELDNAAHLLHPGQFVTAHVGDNAAEDRGRAGVLAVERAAVQTLNGGPVVFVAEHGAYVARKVGLGLRDERWVEVTSGLTEGEQVVVEGAFLLKAQQTLR